MELIKSNKNCKPNYFKKGVKMVEGAESIGSPEKQDEKQNVFWTGTDVSDAHIGSVLTDAKYKEGKHNKGIAMYWERVAVRTEADKEKYVQLRNEQLQLASKAERTHDERPEDEERWQKIKEEIKKLTN